MTPADLIARHKGFTPGPWETDSRVPTRVTGPNDRGICSTGGYQTNTVDADILNAESEANAALIADAPLMLAALTAQAERIAELEKEGARLRRETWLGLATTGELLEELHARAEVQGVLDYRTADSSGARLGR